MTPFDPRLPIIAEAARVKTCHVFHCWQAMREMGRQFHVAAFAAFAGLEPHHVERIMRALESNEALPAKRITGTRRGERLPDDFTPPKDWIDWACEMRRWEPADAREECEIFANYWQSRSGQGAVKLDWKKTWQNWVRNSHRPNGTYSASAPQSAEAWVEYCEARLRLAKDKDYREGIEIWTEKLAEARARVMSNVVPFNRCDSENESIAAVSGRK